MRRLAVFIAVIAVTLLTLASSAWAHVSVSPSTAPRGSFTTLVFQVPNEEESALTTKIAVQFPQDHPIADASVQPVAGWTVDVAKTKLTTPVTTDEGDTLDEAVNTITWTAASGQGIKPGQFQQFLVSVGLPSEGDELFFPTVQTYSEGPPVQWIEKPTGGAEPEHPAPELTLTEATDGGTTTTTVATGGGGNNAALPKNIATKSDVDSAKSTAVVGIVIGAIGVILAAIALVMASRRRGAGPTT